MENFGSFLNLEYDGFWSMIKNILGNWNLSQTLKKKNVKKGTLAFVEWENEERMELKKGWRKATFKINQTAESLLYVWYSINEYRFLDGDKAGSETEISIKFHIF